jgi:hypothetical protein
MTPRIIRKYWTQLLIAFGDDYTVEGFRKTEKHLALPEDLLQYEARLKRELTVCNLFANQNQSISSIAHLLDMNYGQVVTILIDHGFIRDRRRTASEWKIKPGARLLTPETKQPEVLGEATPVESEQVLSFMAPTAEEPNVGPMPEILEIDWPVPDKPVRPESAANLGSNDPGFSAKVRVIKSLVLPHSLFSFLHSKR